MGVNSVERSADTVLPRVSAALIKFISPIASSTDNSSEFLKFRKSKEEFPQSQKRDASKKDKEKQKERNEETQEAEQKPALKLVENQPITNPFVQLLSLFQAQRHTTLLQEGIQKYKKAISLKRIGRSNKGVILDQKSGQELDLEPDEPD